LPDDDAIEAAGFDPDAGTVSRADARCPVCGQVTKAADTRRLAREGKMGQRMVAMVLHHPHQTGKKYRLATPEDEATYAAAEVALQAKLTSWLYLESPLPEELLPVDGTLGFRVNKYGMMQWKDLFNARQQLALVTFLEKIKGSTKPGPEIFSPAPVCFHDRRLDHQQVGFLDELLDDLHEARRRAAIDQPVIEGQAQPHQLADADLTVEHRWLILDASHA
jgi:hypothetical protein